MRRTYFTSNAKTALAVTIANRERDLLKDIDYRNGYSLLCGNSLLSEYLPVLFFQLISFSEMER